MQRNPKLAKDPDEIGEPGRRATDVEDEDEEAIDADAPSPVKRSEPGDEDLAEDDTMEELDEDDLRGMEGPDA